MQKTRRLVVDYFCEVHDLLKPYADEEFWDFGRLTIDPEAVYIISRKEFGAHKDRIRQLIIDGQLRAVFSNPAEGSETIIGQMILCNVNDLALEKKLMVFGGGAMEDCYDYFEYDNFLPKMLDYDENISAIAQASEIYTKLDKPYKFLFLNGRARPNRKYLLERFRTNGLLDQCLWTNLDTLPTPSKHIKFIHDGDNLMNRPSEIKYLPTEYEIERYQNKVGSSSDHNFVKHNLFNNTWGDVYLRPEPYVDTYFSLVTETIFTYPYSFRTEKIWKPIVMGQPWICASNHGYYKDLQNLGYRTFGHLIDESFDTIINDQERIERIAVVVEDLCRQDLKEFLKASEEVCKYNQEHHAEHRVQVRNDFPQQFLKFINERS